MKPSELKPETISHEDLDSNNKYYTPAQIADALESAMEAQRISDISGIDKRDWLAKIAELRGKKPT